MLLAMAVTLATPAALVTAVVLDRVALAPDVGAAKVTVTPLIGLPSESLTVACRGLAKLAPDSAVCGVPPVAAMLAGAPAWLVSAKVAVNVPTVAVTE